MADHEWNFAKAGSACCVCQTAFVPEQRYFSALIHAPAGTDGAPGLLRQDYCSGCFETQRPQNIYYFWKAAQPGEDGNLKPQRPRIDVEYVFDFFKRLDGENAAQRIAFRYILALMLARKKMLVFEGKKKDAAGNEIHLFREKRGGQTHSVIEPVLSEDEIAGVSAELGVLLGLNPPAPKTEAAAAPDAVGAAVQSGEAGGDPARRTTE